MPYNNNQFFVKGLNDKAEYWIYQNNKNGPTLFNAFSTKVEAPKTIDVGKVNKIESDEKLYCTDLLCEGPIEGLVDKYGNVLKYGTSTNPKDSDDTILGKGIYYNDVPLIDSKLNKFNFVSSGFEIDYGEEVKNYNYGNYPFITSSECLPYGACSLGFPPQKIKNVFACAKIYDTRSGTDPLFPESLLEDPILLSIADAGKEYGTTTGRRRKVNWLNLDKLCEAIKVGGATHLVINKCDIIKQIGIYKAFHEGKIIEFKTFDELQDFIDFVCYNSSDLLEYIYYSSNPETIEGFNV